MFDFIKKIFSKKCLGIDIGTAYIKVVEMRQAGGKNKLENYGQVSSRDLYKKENLFSSQEAAESIKSVLKEAKIKTKRAVFSIPDFSTFFTSLELPPMSKEELPQAIKYEARRYVPLPIEEVVLDWQIIENGGQQNNSKIVLMAVPHKVVDKYKETAKLSGLELTFLEAEAFSLMKALVGKNENNPVALVDIGSKSTVCSIANKKFLNCSHSLSMSGNLFTSAIEKKLGIKADEAEKLQKQFGIIGDPSKQSSRAMRDALIPLIDRAMKEIKEILEDFRKKEGQKVEKIIIAGGPSLLPGLRNYFAVSLGQKVELGNPFSEVSYPPILKKTVSEMGPEFAVAIGSALRGFKY